MQVLAMHDLTREQWEDCYEFYVQVYRESYPYRDLLTRESFLTDPGPFTTMTSRHLGFALCEGREWIACCHYRVNAEQKVLISEVKFREAHFHARSAARMQDELLRIARAENVGVLQMVAETAAVRDHYIGSGAFHKVGQVRESVLDAHELDPLQQKAWRHEARAYALKAIDWDDAIAAVSAAALHDEGMEDVPLQNAVAMRRRYDQAYFQELRDKLRLRGRDLLSFGLYDGEAIIGVTHFECSQQEPQTFIILFTGIARHCRGRGIGKGLKALTVAQLQQDFPAFRYMVTGNEETNQPMLRINLAMGFRIRTEFTMLRYARELAAPG